MKTRFNGGRFKDNSGQVAVLFALALLPICVMAGFAVDAARLISAEQHLQRAIDAAALAGSKEVRTGTDTADIESVVERVFFANLETSHDDLTCETPQVVSDTAENSAQVSSRCVLPTMFGRTISGQQTMAVAETATAKASYTQLEVAMALDMSESMVGTKSEQLQTALRRAVNALVPDDDINTRVSFVPYGTSVNAGLYGNRAMGRVDHDDRAGDGTDRVCMLYRDGLETASDATPIAGDWVNELPHPRRCYLPRLEPLTAGKDTLLDMVEDFEADANEQTSTHIGIVWSWYTLSPLWDSVWPTASKPTSYSDLNTRKAMILMTDGRLNVWYVPDYFMTQFPEAAKAHQLAQDACGAMQDEGIITYVVEFDMDGASAGFSGAHLSLMSSMYGVDPNETLSICAGDPSRHFHADDEEELTIVYETIVRQLRGVALTH